MKVVLFGSYANGKPNPDSDVDLLVVIKDILLEGKVLYEAPHR
ncbi:MAG: nucleotidyltransferase domain-containing protein [bacterium]